MKYLAAFAVIVSVQIKSMAQNVGIGTNTPLTPLHIQGGGGEMIRLQGFTPWIGFMNNIDGNYRGFLYYPDTSLVMGSIAGSNMRLILAPNNQALLHATADQRIGIGTSSPAEKLDVEGNIKTSGLLKFSGSAPAAFRITLTPELRYSSINPLTPDPTTGVFVLVDHPLCNNDPEAILFITSVDFVAGISTPLMRITYEPGIGRWFLRGSLGFFTNNQNRWNILIVKNTP
jgi:hypothetical protein